MSPVSLPAGFRFHPTDEELVAHYLSRKINGRKIDLEFIPQVDLYKCEPWDLPGKSLLPSKDMEWYFFSPRDRKYPNGSRTNRATKAGYWKATGKDRKVSSQNRSVGMKKTLVYYRGRAPHGARSNWVMHEYRLDERECETASGLQDAYALCRVFKKSAVPIKAGEGFNTTGAIQRSAGYSYSNDYSISRSTCSPSIVNDGSSSSDEYYLNDARWVQPTPEESFNFPLSSSFSNPGSISYPPSQVDIALEFARQQNRFPAPPLAPESFPQNLHFDDANLGVTYDPNTTTTSTSKCNVLQEIPSVAQASQDLIQQTVSNPFFSWDDPNYAPNLDKGFEFAAGAVPAFDHCERDVEISDLVSDIKVGGMTENLRWVGMSDKDLLKTFGEKNKIMPIESITSYNRGNESLNQGKSSNSGDGHGHINDEIDLEVNFTSSDDGWDAILRIERGRDQLDDRYSDSPCFKIVEETKVSHDMFVVTRQAAETMFHPMVPSEVIKVQSLHHGMIRNETVPRITEPGKGSILYTLSNLMVHIACVGGYFLSGEDEEHSGGRYSINTEGIRRWGSCRSGRSMSIAIGGRTMLLFISTALALSCVCA